MTNVRAEVGGGSVQLLATDRYRASHGRLPATGAGTALITGKALLGDSQGWLERYEQIVDGSLEGRPAEPWEARSPDTL